MKRLFTLLAAVAMLINLPCVFSAGAAGSGFAYTAVYEPETSWAMSATVAWRADGSALSAAAQAQRPATAFIWLDEALRVYDRSGKLLSDSLDAYVSATAGGMIPSFYLSDAAAANALKSWLLQSGLKDCYVVSKPENRSLVKQVADLVHVRGMLDYTDCADPDRDALLEMVSCTNGSHGKVILLSGEAATRENVRFLQSLTMSVWVRSPSDQRTLLTHCTNGVNGLLVDDYHSAFEALTFFRDDAPTLLRLPQIIGHRGDPSAYVENTLDSFVGAVSEGVRAVETDIHLSADNEVFLFHDDYPKRFLGLEETDASGLTRSTESYTLDELRSHFFDWDDPDYGILACNEVPVAASRWGSFYGQDSRKQYVVPTLQELISAVKDSGCMLNVEIKSYRPEILPYLRQILNRNGFRDRVFCSSFNRAILDAMYAGYPELSVGALGFSGNDASADYMTAFQDYQAIEAESGSEAALEALFGEIDRWNATYNPSCAELSEATVRAGRHRGLGVFPWTYTAANKDEFAHDFLLGVSGMITDVPWIASDLVAELRAEDLACASEDLIPKPTGVTVGGAELTLDGAELIRIKAISDTQALMIWRYRQELVLDGESFGSYYLYSNPFVFRIGAPTGFRDVPEDAYFASPVGWAVQRGITDGTTDDTFSPEAFCTRAQAVTFLWRAVGYPEAQAEQCRFRDVDPDAYYYPAVLWAASAGVTDGTSEDAFSPDEICTRAQVVTFLWRTLGKPAGGTEQTPFVDVPQNAYFRAPVLWAYAEGVTDGTGERTFSPEAECMRAHVVTFLYRTALREDQ